MTTSDTIRQFIFSSLPHGRRLDELTDDLPLLEERIVDSMGIFEIVSFIETEFGVEVRNEELVPHRFATVAALTQLVEEKLASRADGSGSQP